MGARCGDGGVLVTFWAGILSSVFDRGGPFRFSGERDPRPIEDLADALVSEPTDVAGRQTAEQVLDAYGRLDDEARRAFFHHLAQTMDVDPEAVRASMAAYEASPDRASYRAFLAAVDPARQELIRRINRVAGATKELVNMRADLLRLGRGDPALEAIDLDFKHLFQSWFNRGFLVLRPINWESHAAVMEKILAYEAVPVPESATASINYGFDRIRFLSPVRSGARLRGRFILRGLERGDGVLTLSLTAIMECEGEERPALAAEWIVRLSVT